MSDLTAGLPLPGPMVVAVTEVDWNPGISRRAEVELIDTAGITLRLIDYEGAGLSINWQPNHRYRISHCNVNEGSHGVELAPSKRTVVELLGACTDSTRILLVGDTHIGRRKHPKTGAEIDPLGAFAAAIQYGIDRDVAAVLHVGDIFHDSATLSKAILARQEVFDPLREAGIPFYYVQGNHGFEDGDQLLDELEVVVNLDTDGVTVGDDVRVFGVDHYPGGEIPWEALTFPRSVAESAPILVLHQTLEQLTGVGNGSVDVGRIQQLFNGRFDLIVSGHHHDAIVQDWNGVPVMYTGAAERMSKNKDPTDRVVWLLTVAGGTLSYEQYQIP